MKVEIHQATLEIEGRKVRLTKAIAKQFPFLHGAQGSERWRRMEQGLPVPRPICKIAGHVLGETYFWLYLVPNKEAGLAWVSAVPVSDTMRASIEARGGYVDDPASVPTVIL